jgi:pyruvate ferredoxin oxidoreductase alpha subunit
VLLSFVGGLGGKDISPGEFRHVIAALENAAPGTVATESELLWTETDWQQVEPLLDLAGRREGVGA